MDDQLTPVQRKIMEHLGFTEEDIHFVIDSRGVHFAISYQGMLKFAKTYEVSE